MDQLERIYEILRDAVRRGELWAYSDLAEVEYLLEEQQAVFELAGWMRGNPDVTNRSRMKKPKPYLNHSVKPKQENRHP